MEQRNKKTFKKTLCTTFSIICCMVLIGSLCILPISADGFKEDYYPWDDFIDGVIPLESIRHVSFATDRGNSYNTVNIPLLNNYTSVEQLRNYTSTTQLQGRVNTTNFLLRPSLYNGERLSSAIIDAQSIVNETPSLWISSLDVNAYAYDGNGIRVDFTSLHLIYNNNDDRIIIIGYEDISVDDNPNVNEWFLFSQPVEAYNSTFQYIQYASDDYSTTQGPNNINTTIYLVNPIFTPQYLFDDVGDTLINPWYVWFTQTDGNWLNTAKTTMQQYIDTSNNTLVNDYIISNSYTTGHGSGLINIHMSNQVFAYDEINDTNNIFLSVYGGNYNTIEKIKINYTMTFPCVDSTGNVNGIRSTFENDITDTFENIELLYMLDNPITSEQYPNYTFSGDVIIEDIIIQIFHYDNDKYNNQWSGSTQITIAQSVNLKNKHITTILLDIDTSKPPVIIGFYNFAEWLKTVINSILAIEFIPMLSIGFIITFITGVGLFIWLLKVFAGG